MKPPKGTRAHCTDCGRTWDDPRGHTRACKAPVPDPVCRTTDCANFVESSEDYCTDCLDRKSEIGTEHG